MGGGWGVMEPAPPEPPHLTLGKAQLLYQVDFFSEAESPPLRKKKKKVPTEQIHLL